MKTVLDIVSTYLATFRFITDTLRATAMPTNSRHRLIGAAQRDSEGNTIPYPISLSLKAVISYPRQGGW
jgi:hypothetical protein